MSPEAVRRWIEEALSRARRLPGVMSAGATSRCRLPAAAGIRIAVSRSKGRRRRSTTEGRLAVDYVVTPGLLETLRVPLREGRLFADGDGAGRAAGRDREPGDGASLLGDSVTTRCAPPTRRRPAWPVAHRRRRGGRHPQRRCRSAAAAVSLRPAAAAAATHDDAHAAYGLRPGGVRHRRCARQSPSSIRTSRSTTCAPCAKCGRRIYRGSRILIQVMGALAARRARLAGLGSGESRRNRLVSARARSACAWRSAPPRPAWAR